MIRPALQVSDPRVREAAPERARLVALDVDYAEYRRQVIFRCCKWDPQVGDVGTISDHACVLSAEAAGRLTRLAETLAAETRQLERALAERPDLLGELGFDQPLRRLLGRAPPHAEHVRVMRFDFHPTDDGWALSEVNSDVPGGFAEASALPRLAASFAHGASPGGDAAGRLVSAFAERLPAGSRVGFVHATAYADDRQVMEFLAGRFADAGFSTVLLAPDHLRWHDGYAVSIAESCEGPVDAVVRFFPADWLVMLPARAGWRGYFSARTPAANPPHALLSQSKRLPLVWDRLGVAAPAWRAALPETRDPRDAPWRTDDAWLVKPAFGRVGEGVAWPGRLPEKDWRSLTRAVARHPRAFVAQRRFASRPLPSAGGDRHLCVGVFTVDGEACGFYGRVSSRDIIEKHAEDTAVLVET